MGVPSFVLLLINQLKVKLVSENKKIFLNTKPF